MSHPNNIAADALTLSVVCPVCKAEAGAKCLNGGALPSKFATTDWVHPARAKAAKLANAA